MGLIEKIESGFVVVSIVDVDVGVDSGAWSLDPDPVCRLGLLPTAKPRGTRPWHVTISPLLSVAESVLLVASLSMIASQVLHLEFNLNRT